MPDDCRIPWNDPAHPRFHGQRIYQEDDPDDDDDSDLEDDDFSVDENGGES